MIITIFTIFIGIYFCCNLLFMRYMYSLYLKDPNKPDKKFMYSLMAHALLWGSIWYIYNSLRTK